MIRLLGRATSGNVQKVLFLLEEMGLPYKREDYGRQFNNTGGDYLKLNPTGKVPTLIDGDTAIWESNTILRYLAAKNGSPLYPSDPARRTEVERWMDWLLASLNTPYVAVFKEAKKTPAERAASFSADAKELASRLQLLDAHLARQPYLAGQEMSIADIALGPIVARCLDFPIDRPDLPNLKAWRERIAARPAFQKATAA
ncbi:MAG: glutathione S-transferase [Rhodospirillales bacterium]|jgi:glutathione S-transferase|nr:glutathione S-transferase [Rhodospirillales bacterium]